MESQTSPRWQSLQRLLFSSRGFVWVNGVSLGLLGSMSLYARLFNEGKNFSRLFADPYINSRYAYLGFLTNLTEAVWCIALAICLFSFGVVRSLRPGKASDFFFLGTAFVIAVLLLDDVQRITLMMHYRLGVSKLLSYSAYSLMLLSYAAVFRRHIVQHTPYYLLLITLFCFGLSTASDLLLSVLDIHHFQGTASLLEDGTKLLGLLNLVLFCWKTGQQEIAKTVQHLRRY